MNQTDEPPERGTQLFRKGLEHLERNLTEPMDRLLFGDAINKFEKGVRVPAERLKINRHYSSQLYLLFVQGLGKQGYVTKNGEAKEMQRDFDAVLNLYYALKQGIEL